MRHYLFIIISILSLLCVVQVANSSERIVTKGKWGDNRIRTIIPAAPEASISGGTLEIYVADALSNLTVCVTDANGQVVYLDCISTGEGNYTFVVPNAFEPGEYFLSLSHAFGVLEGGFTVY